MIHRRGLAVEVLESRQMLATITVNSLADTPPIFNDSVVTLREAIRAASENIPVGSPSVTGNATVPDLIVFSTSLPQTSTIDLSLALGELQVNNVGTQPANADLTIDASALSSLTISGSDPSAGQQGDGIRVFHVFDPSNWAAVALTTLKRLTIAERGVEGEGGANCVQVAIASDGSMYLCSSAGRRGKITESRWRNQ